MSWLFFLPLLLVAVATVAVAPVAHRLRPPAGTWCLTGLASAALVAAAGSAAAVIASGIPGGGALAERYGWCRHIVGHGSWPAAAATALLAVLAVGNVVRLLQRERRELRGLGGGPAVQLVDLPAARALAVPGRPGSIVVTTGMLSLLSVEERRAMFAHERAHLDLHHHRFVRTVSVAAAALPPLKPLVKRVRFTTERWADERAAREVGDRAPLARALIRAALSGGDEPQRPVMAAAGLGVAARVRALTAEPRRPVWEPLALGAMVAGLAGAATQSHHLATMVQHLCA